MNQPVKVGGYNRFFVCLLLLVFISETATSFVLQPIARSFPLQQQPLTHSPSFSREQPQKGSTQLQASAMIMDLVVRGGAASEAALNLGLESYKLQSMATYSTITALIMNACMRLYTSQKFSKKEEGYNRWIEYAFTAFTTSCVLCGVFTALVFNLISIYSKESIGMGNTAGYLAFRDATAVYRMWGFRTFLLTSLSFIGSFGISVWEKCNRRKRGRWIAAFSALVVLFSAFHIQTILGLATEFIYTPEFCGKNGVVRKGCVSCG